MNPAWRFCFLRALSCDSSSLTPDVCVGHLVFLSRASKTPAAVALTQPDLNPLPILKPVHSLRSTLLPRTLYIQSP
jgi:hypothetical protein